MISQLIQIQEVITVSSLVHQVDFQEMLGELTKIRNSFGKKPAGGLVKVNQVRVIAHLDIVSDNLNKLIGKTKIVIGKGD